MEKSKLLSFHSDPAIKEKYLARVHAHQAADEIIKGTYWESGKGCAVGCTIHSGKHLDYEKELGLPEWLAHLEDGIFENLPNEDAMRWPVEFLEAIPVGVDLEPVKRRFFIWLLTDETDGLINKVEDKKIKQLISVIARLWAIDAVRPLTADEVDEGNKAALDAQFAFETWCVLDFRYAWYLRAALDSWHVRAALDTRFVWSAWSVWNSGHAFVKKSSKKLLDLLRSM